MKILYTAFNGKNNASKILLDHIKTEKEHKLYLKNSFITSVDQLKQKIKRDEYDMILSFGEASLSKNTIQIETMGKDKDFYITNYNYLSIKKKLEDKTYKVIVSNDAGNYYCNHIYYHGLKYIDKNKLKCKMLFIHIPSMNNIENIEILASIFEKVY